MSRQETSNTFADGLNMDLNPINTPATVLTDNINGTLITYNGNELILQNDQGNYKLENCKLRANYIPVGVKEYADTLYIVSYNPLDKHIEVGSYPSPKTIESTKYEDITSKTITSIIEQVTGALNQYTNLIKLSNYILFYDGDDDSYKLYPGDKYKLDVTNDTSVYKYEEISYIIIDENQKKWDITKNIKNDSISQTKESNATDDDGFHYVSWQIPGWLGAQYRLANLSEFDVNPRYVYLPPFEKNSWAFKTKLNFQIKIDDSLIIKELLNNVSDLHIKLHIEDIYSNNDLYNDIIDIPSENLLDWYDNTYLLYVNKEIENGLAEVNKRSIIKIVATPYIVDNNNKQIYYDNFTTELTFSMSSVGSINDIKIGTNTYQWLVDNGNTNYADNVYVTFDISGPIVVSQNVKFVYRILSLNPNGTGDPIKPWTLSDDSWQIGTTSLSIDFDEPVIVNGTLNKDYKFIQENAYILEFGFISNDIDITNQTEVNNNILRQDSWSRLFIPSIVFNSFWDKNISIFDKEITFKDWSEKFKDYIIYSDNFVLDKNTSGEIIVYDKEVYDDVIGTDVDKTYWSKIIKDDVASNAQYLFLENKPENLKIRKGYTFYTQGTASLTYTGLTGQLWKNLIKDASVTTYLTTGDTSSVITNNQSIRIPVQAYKELLLDTYTALGGANTYNYSPDIVFKKALRDINIADIPVLICTEASKKIYLQTLSGVIVPLNGSDKLWVNSMSDYLYDTTTNPNGMGIVHRWTIGPDLEHARQDDPLIGKNNNDIVNYLHDKANGLYPMIAFAKDGNYSGQKGIGYSQNDDVLHNEDNDRWLITIFMFMKTSNGVFLFDPCKTNDNYNVLKTGDCAIISNVSLNDAIQGKGIRYFYIKETAFGTFYRNAINIITDDYTNLYYSAINIATMDGNLWYPVISNDSLTWSAPKIKTTKYVSFLTWNYNINNAVLNLLSTSARNNITITNISNLSLLQGSNPVLDCILTNSTDIDIDYRTQNAWPDLDITEDGVYHIGFDNIKIKIQNLANIDTSDFINLVNMISNIKNSGDGSTIGATWKFDGYNTKLDKINKYLRNYKEFGSMDGNAEMRVKLTKKSGKADRPNNGRKVAFGATDINFKLK